MPEQQSCLRLAVPVAPRWLCLQLRGCLAAGLRGVRLKQGCLLNQPGARVFESSPSSENPRLPAFSASGSRSQRGLFCRTRVRTLERQLEAKMMKEERDFHDLESAVRQVEQNLELMTVGRRALPAAGGEGRGSSRPGRGVAPRRGPGRPSVGCGGTGAPDPGAGAPAARRRRLLCPRPHVRGTSLCLFVFLPFSLSFSCVRVWGGMAEACGEGRKSRRETEAGSELAPGDSRDTPTTVRAARVPDKTPKGLCAFFPAPATEPQIGREGFPLGP